MNEIQQSLQKKTAAEKIDEFFNKILPKKFIVFSIATIVLWMDKINGEQWFYISIAYLGGNVLSKVPGVFKGDKQ
jgi:hypothetical protein